MINERHILINGECLISVYSEGYGSGTSGAGTIFSFFFSSLRCQRSHGKKKKQLLDTLIRERLALDIIVENAASATSYHESIGKQMCFSSPCNFLKYLIIRKHFGVLPCDYFQASAFVVLHQFSPGPRG